MAGAEKDKAGTLAFWQRLIRYGVAFDLAEFGWAKICHRLLLRGSIGADSVSAILQKTF
jgi:hypothetical protein